MRFGAPRPAPFAALLLLLLGGTGASAVQPPAGPGSGLVRGGEREYVPGELIVAFRPGVSASARADVLEESGARRAGAAVVPGVELVELPRGASVPLEAAALERDPRVLYAEPNHVYRLTATPNDPLYGQLWGLHQASDRDIDAPEAWNLATGSKAVVVAVIDSGIDYDHPDLAPNMWVNDDPPGGGDQDGNGKVDDTLGWDFVQNDNVPRDYNGHGTHVAGTIGAKGNNALGVVGVNWNVSLMAVRAADPNGSLTDADIAAAFAYACAEGAHVVNGSFGGSGFSQTVANVVTSAACQTTLFVFAAGNSGWNLETNTSTTNAYPCELHRPPANGGVSAANVICVASTTDADVRSSFSNFGATAVHLAAPGSSILSAWPGYSTIAGSADGFEDPGFATRWGDPTPATGTLWDRTSAVKANGTYSLTDSPAGNYPNSANRRIRRLTPLDLSGRFGCRIEYQLRLDTEFGWDFFDVLAGTSTATPVLTASWSGSTGDAFVAMDDDLSPADGAATAYVWFGLDSDGSAAFDGAYVDDMLVKCLSPGTGGYESLNGTSMASPHVAGVAALLLSRNSGLSVALLKTAILGSVDAVPALSGLVSTGGRLNANAALLSVTDTTAPDTAIDSGPSGVVASTAAVFAFSASEPGTFECRLDGAAFAACTSPTSYTGLAQGGHVFRVRAIDVIGNVDPTPVERAWTVDTVAPQTTIDSGPSGVVASIEATLAFSASEPATFECSLDGGAFAACASPSLYSALGEGSHTFRVRAVDAAGNVDVSPAERMWTVDTVAPETTIVSGPSGAVASTAATFSFSASEPATFECSHDGDAFAACASPTVYAGLGRSVHSFRVRAIDMAGNVDASPAERAWTVDTVAPQTTITGGPKGKVKAKKATFKFKATEAGSTFECKLDKGAFKACKPGVKYTKLKKGKHTFQVRAKDRAGNVDRTPAKRTWTVK